MGILESAGAKLAASWIGRLWRFFRDGGLEAREREQASQEQILSSRAEVASLRKEKAELEQRLAGMQKFESEVEQYLAIALATGAVVYVARGSDAEKMRGRRVRDSGRDDDRCPMCYCARCFERREKSLLQPEPRSGNYSCRECGSVIPFPSLTENPGSYRPVRASRRDQLRRIL